MRRLFVFACCAAICLNAFLSAQTRRTAADPVSGTWTGELRRQNAGNPREVTLTLKLDAKGGVSGTMTGMPSPADVKQGRFDRKTGALRLELGKTGEPAVLLTLDGTVANGKATGKISGEASGEFVLTKTQ